MENGPRHSRVRPRSNPRATSASQGQLGAIPSAAGTLFRLWSTRARAAAVRLQTPGGRRDLPLEPRGEGVFERLESSVGPGALYSFVLDERELPDPYARSLPQGVHGPARVEPRRRVQIPAPPPLESWIVYELHIGTFTPEGTFRAARDRLPELQRLGVTCLELMPVSSFHGRRGWGYDGVAHFAPHVSYGEPEELRGLVSAAHDLGMGVILDVVYNHFGPAGNYLGAYSPEYFTAAHKTPWGDGPDFANPFMRAYFLDNARYWLEEFGFDGLRLDATHQIVDPSPVHFLRELADTAASLSPARVLIAEDDRNDPRLVSEYGLSALWADDFHHVLHVLFTRERDGYYAAYGGTPAELVRVIERGWLYEGQAYAPTDQPRGHPADALDAAELVYSIQNHDQVGNRACGERLCSSLDVTTYSALSMLLLFLPMTPLVFMGQEWAASTPFCYFTDHEPALGGAVTRGRREEFKHFRAFADPAARTKIPDPQREETFLASKLDWSERSRPPHAQVLALYQTMLELRRADPVLRASSRAQLSVACEGDLFVARRWLADEERWLLFNLALLPRPLPERWREMRLLACAGFDALRHELAPGAAALFSARSESGGPPRPGSEPPFHRDEGGP